MDITFTQPRAGIAIHPRTGRAYRFCVVRCWGVNEVNLHLLRRDSDIGVRCVPERSMSDLRGAIIAQYEAA